MNTKTLADIQQDMSELYEELKAGTRERVDAAEMANIAGKFLKAEQLILAREVLLGKVHGVLGKAGSASAAQAVLEAK